MLSFNYDGVHKFLRRIERCPFHTCEKHFVQSESTCHNVPLFANAVNTFIHAFDKQVEEIFRFTKCYRKNMNGTKQDNSRWKYLPEFNTKNSEGKVRNLIVSVNIFNTLSLENMSKRKQIYSRLSFSYTSVKNSVELRLLEIKHILDLCLFFFGI